MHFWNEDEETQVFLAETENQMTKRTLKAKNEAELLKAVDLLVSLFKDLLKYQQK